MKDYLVFQVREIEVKEEDSSNERDSLRASPPPSSKGAPETEQPLPLEGQPPLLTSKPPRQPSPPGGNVSTQSKEKASPQDKEPASVGYVFT